MGERRYGKIVDIERVPRLAVQIRGYITCSHVLRYSMQISKYSFKF